MLSTLREDVSPDKYRSFAERWVDAGASVIGGCCGIGPEHIAELNELRR
ncbi:MAG: homocysteine S-methyltransferase family protein [Pseudomonadota bacterium]|nr:homocysteine S-methyltransferase family protein [Pseudomonadota bacterium]